MLPQMFVFPAHQPVYFLLVIYAALKTSWLRVTFIILRFVDSGFGLFGCLSFTVSRKIAIKRLAGAAVASRLAWAEGSSSQVTAVGPDRGLPDKPAADAPGRRDPRENKTRGPKTEATAFL